jgi:hypothetical protein
MNIIWERAKDVTTIHLEDISVDSRQVGWIEKRPAYCDRGHWRVVLSLADIDHQDQFPRYYMSYDVAKRETEEFLRWRFLKERSPNEHCRNGI